MLYAKWGKLIDVFLSSKILTDFIPQSISFLSLALLPGWLRAHSIPHKSRAMLNDG
jgi:hypothetical protein